MININVVVGAAPEYALLEAREDDKEFVCPHCGFGLFWMPNGVKVKCVRCGRRYLPESLVSKEEYERLDDKGADIGEDGEGSEAAGLVGWSGDDEGEEGAAA